jgi:pyroglutamyl-peptidase
MKLLLTGFDPFGGEKINPALEVVKQVKDQIANVQIIKLKIPTVFDQSADKIYQAIKEEQPDVVLNVGQAGGRDGITPERVAINLNDARISDNQGQQPLDQLIHKDGQTAYFTQLPVKKIVAAIQAQGIPSYVSTTAGTFVCNHVMYQVQYLIDKDFPQLKAGFIHLPYLPQQVAKLKNMPSLSLADDVQGLTAAIKVIGQEFK